jgi:putative heme transporter
VDDEPRLLGLGRRAWATLGILGVAVLVLLAIGRVSVLAISVFLAMFPAALMSPLATWLRGKGVPGAVVGLSLVSGLLLVLGGILWFLVPRFVEEIPALGDALVRGVEQIDDAVPWASLPGEVESLEELWERGIESVGDSDDIVGRGVDALVQAGYFLTGLLLLLVTLFFMLKDGRRLWQGPLDLVPARYRGDVDAMGTQVWWTLGAYLRGQLLVALFDAVFIGIGLVLLGVPLAVPLAVLVFLGGFIPIVGAFVSGLAAVLVALADQGLTTAILVLALVIVVQQVEGNVLEPWIMSGIIALHPLLIILVVTAGALTLGIFGAFIAVPVAASVARIVDYLRGREPAAGPVAT